MARIRKLIGKKHKKHSKKHKKSKGEKSKKVVLLKY